jgi:hypothetical protein
MARAAFEIGAGPINLVSGEKWHTIEYVVLDPVGFGTVPD